MAVEIIPNDQWLGAIGDTSRGTLMRNPSRKAVIQALYECGPFLHPEGLATRDLHEAAAARGYGASLVALNGALRQPSMALAIDRDVKGRRVFRYELVRIPEAWADWIPKQNGVAEPEREPEPTPEPVTDEVPERGIGSALLPEPDGWGGISGLPRSEPDTEALRLEVASSVAT